MSDEKAHPGAEQLRKDVNVGALYKFLIVLAIVCILALIGMWGTFVFLNGQAAARDPQLSPLAVKPDTLPPDPILQVNEPADLKKIQEAEEQILKSYAWIDKEKGIVRIPIEEAIRIVAAKKELQNVAPLSAEPQTATTETAQP